MSNEPFYSQGLRFGCTRCSACCTRESGYVFLSALDMRRLARRLDLCDEEFFLEYCEVVDLEIVQRVSLVADDSVCVFWKDGGCSVYEDRPLQCRAYPFWGVNLVDRRTWARGAEECPGIHQGRLWSREEIEEWLNERERDPLLDVGKSGQA